MDFLQKRLVRRLVAREVTARPTMPGLRDTMFIIMPKDETGAILEFEVGRAEWQAILRLFQRWPEIEHYMTPQDLAYMMSSGEVPPRPDRRPTMTTRGSSTPSLTGGRSGASILGDRPALDLAP